MIFIDGSNFYHSSKSSFPDLYRRIDFQKLVELLRGSRMLVSANYYTALLDRGVDEKRYWKQQSLLNKLRKIPGFKVVLCKMRKDKDISQSSGFRFVVKGDDIHIAADMVGDAYENKYDTAILVSGDGDFVSAIERVQKLGRRVENAYFKNSGSGQLKAVCNSSILIDRNFIESCLDK
ncbi:MAG TPA: NYN domain-containing protein [archaeon]|nr:NYN domain-containing protein [archaeon]